MAASNLDNPSPSLLPWAIRQKENHVILSLEAYNKWLFACRDLVNAWYEFDGRPESSMDEHVARLVGLLRELER